MFDRKKIIIISAFLVLLITILILIWFFRQPSEPVITPPANLNIDAERRALEIQLEQLPPASPEKTQEAETYSLELKQLSFAFAERFGSYSTDSGHKNLLDLKPFMTARMQQIIDNFIAANPVSQEIFEGFDTMALSSELLDFNQGAGRAAVLVKTQRTRYTGEDKADTFYQNLSLRFVRTASGWLVDEANWQ